MGFGRRSTISVREFNRVRKKLFCILSKPTLQQCPFIKATHFLPMKKLLLLLSAIFAVAITSHAQVQQQMQFAIKSITPLLVQTPAFTYSPPIPQARPDTRKWLMIQVQFAAVAAQRDATTDELQFNYFVAMSDGKMYTGQVNHVNIPVGSQLYSMMLMSPDALLKISATTKRPFAISDVANIYVQITKPGVSAPLAAKVMKSIGTSGWWTQMSQTSGFLVDQSATPFAPIVLQNYVAIKPASSR